MQVIRLSIFVAILSMLFACGKSEGVSTTPAPGYTYIRFLTPSGTNIIDSLCADYIKNRHLNYDIYEGWVNVEAYRTSDNQSLPVMKNLRFTEGDADSLKDALFEIYWLDFKTCDIEREVYSYDETYVVNFQSPKLFGDSVTHTIKWNVSIYGKTLDAYKCSIDGQDVDLENDSAYKAKTYLKWGIHCVNAVLTFRGNKYEP